MSLLCAWPERRAGGSAVRCPWAQIRVEAELLQTLRGAKGFEDAFPWPAWPCFPLLVRSSPAAAGIQVRYVPEYSPQLRPTDDEIRRRNLLIAV